MQWRVCCGFVIFVVLNHDTKERDPQPWVVNRRKAWDWRDICSCGIRKEAHTFVGLPAKVVVFGWEKCVPIPGDGLIMDYGYKVGHYVDLVARYRSIWVEIAISGAYEIIYCLVRVVLVLCVRVEIKYNSIGHATIACGRAHGIAYERSLDEAGQEPHLVRLRSFGGDGHLKLEVTGDIAGLNGC